MFSNNKKKISRIIFFITITIIFLFLFFNEYGILKYLQLKNDIGELNSKIEMAESEIKKLKKEIDSLKHSNIKIEKVAREKYHMLRENERALRIEEK